MEGFSLHKKTCTCAIIKNSANAQYAVPFNIFKRRFEHCKIAEKKPVQLIFEYKVVTISGNEMGKIEKATKEYKQNLIKKVYNEEKRGPFTLRLQKIINNRAMLNL